MKTHTKTQLQQREKRDERERRSNMVCEFVMGVMGEREELKGKK